MLILLTSFSKEELLEYDITQNAIKNTFEVPLACPEDSEGEEGFREIDITLIIKAPISWLGLFG